MPLDRDLGAAMIADATAACLTLLPLDRDLGAAMILPQKDGRRRRLPLDRDLGAAMMDQRILHGKPTQYPLIRRRKNHANR